jgi:hypothetical protein
MELSQDQIILILGILLGASELIALNPKMESNSILQLVISSLKSILGKKKEKPEIKVEKIAEDLAKDAAIKLVEDEIEKLKK